MNQKTTLLITLIFALAFSGSERGYGFLMLEEPLSAKSIAMGGAGTALAGAGFRYYNPVQPFFSSASYVSVEFGRMPGGVNKGGVESALIFPSWYSALGFHSSSLDFETRDERGFGSSASSNTTMGSLSGGLIRGRLAVGVSVNSVQDRIWVSSTYSAISMSAGLGYKLFDGKLNLGAAGFHGVAKSTGFGGNDSTWHNGKVPRFARAGGAWMDTVKSFPFTIAADMVYRDENGTISVPVGAEVRVLPSVALRIGKRFGWETEIMSLGIGFNIDKVAFDAAFVPSVLVDDYELKWNMGLTYNLGGKRKERAPTAKYIFEDLKVQGETPAGEKPSESPVSEDTAPLDSNQEDGEEKAVEEEAEPLSQEENQDKDLGEEENPVDDGNIYIEEVNELSEEKAPSPEL
ncbi:MAG: hypothetical protein LBI42_02155 [Chitinispirillales bacterium]|jgi:hypothetical protein|nr:hypothetical protein [Chitinispirillales bacterium]